ncbi:cation:proton antiporter [Catenovulum sp. SM1970]|uniref:monovalent cation:proton antiporter family protein n=1 Tax=Marinifaba aquimaris TaxID=2741323 RepID=UPI001572BBC4|nr:monovalent cation:proton antiporter family protein [Marinifaba aquimaris]NTS76095.1 cation:proton antiporter [Marinifaba aquimaris]
MELGIFEGLVLLLATSVLMIAIFRRFNITPILAYLLAGIIAGPSGFSWISDLHDVHFVAELGIVFLLFSLGLEFSFPKLIAMRKMVFGTGTLQVILTLTVIMVICLSLGFSWQGAFAIGCILALSSTAIVIKLLSESGKLQNRKSQLAVSVLLFQDIAVVPMLIVFPILSLGEGAAFGSALLEASLKGIAVFALLIGAGKWILPRVFDEIAQARSNELFVLTTLLVALVAGGVTHLFGLSMALGAFLAGMMLGESQYKHQLEADIRPFRDILMGLFFSMVGMYLNIVTIWESIHWLILACVATLLIKILVIFATAKLMKEKTNDALAVSIKLCQMGEFGFVLAALASENKLISPEVTSILIGVGVLSMAVTPYLINNAQKITNLILMGDLVNSEDKMPGFKSELKDHVVICGFGRVGQTVARFLRTEAIPYIAVDFDPMRVQEAQQAGEKVHFGDANNPDILKAVNALEAQLVIVTLDEPVKATQVVHQVRILSPDIKVIVRTTDDEHLQSLKSAGADEVVPEKLEGSLMLVLHVLFRSGVPVRRIFSRIRRERRSQYNFMHGFFPGENVDIGGEKRDQLEFLHAIPLPLGAHAVGKSIAELGLSDMKIDVVGLRRNSQEIEWPSDSMRIREDDIMVIRAKPHRVEKAERYLLEG